MEMVCRSVAGGGEKCSEQRFPRVFPRKIAQSVVGFAKKNVTFLDKIPTHQEPRSTQEEGSTYDAVTSRCGGRFPSFTRSTAAISILSTP